jgi:uncharacterized membrane protein
VSEDEIPGGELEAPDARAVGAERLIAHVLLWGGVTSALLVVLGLALYAGAGGFREHVLTHHRLVHPDRFGRPPHVFVSVGDVARGLRARPIDPLAVTALGLVVLLMTPVLGVLGALVAFVRARDPQYTAIAAIVFAMLVVSLVAAGGAG